MKCRCLALACFFALTACDDTSTTPPPDAGPADGGVVEDPLRADCDPVVPEFCALPFPSDHWLADDSSTASGHRLAIGATTLPRSRVARVGRRHVDPTPINERDGWSVNGSLLAYLEGATADGLPSPQAIEASLEEGSPTVLIEAETGERVPHFSEIDASVGDDQAPRALIIRPVVPLEHATRYLVAVRGVVDAGGDVIAPTEAFAALRDGTTSGPAVESRRAAIDAVLGDLEGHGVARADLQLAWDFTTGSLETDTAWMLAVRDAALAAVGEDGPDFFIDSVVEFTEAENAHIARRVEGQMTVPLFLDQPGANAVLNLGADGMPEQNGTADYPFIVNIPRNASPTNKMRPIQYGHGLLGTRHQANAGWLAEFGNTNGYIPFGVDWIGMNEEDVGPITVALSNGTLEDFRTVPERLIQGVVNALLAMRMMRGGFGDHPMIQVDGESIIDTSAGFYTGDSQGGIFGGTYMALTTDVERGILGVPGQPYQLLLNRSVDFDPYLALLRATFHDGVEIQLALAAIQLLWDRAEPGTYTRHIETDLFPDTPAHSVILQAAIGDHQVTTLAAHIMARAIGAVAIAPQTRPMWGIEEVDGPHVGSAIVEFDYGLEEPVENVPTRTGDDPHGSVRRNPRALEQTRHFFETGEVIHTCDGPCDPE